MASDGLWERITNEEAQEIVRDTYDSNDHDEKIYTQMARDLVLAARGTFGKKGWRTKKDQIASGDDITVFVIPLNCHLMPIKPGCLGETCENPLESAPITYASGNPDFLEGGGAAVRN